MQNTASGRQSRLDLLFDSCCLARQIAQVVQLRAADTAPALDRDIADGGAVCLEHTLNALAMRNLAHCERRVESAIADRDHDTLVRLDTLAVAFDHLHLHDHGVAGLEVRYFPRHA